MNPYDVFLHFIKQNRGREFKSPRKQFGGRSPMNFRIVDFNNEKLKMQFDSGTTLPLHFWRFETAIDNLNQKTFIPIGARISEDYDASSLEGILKEGYKKRTGNKTDTKTAPHIADILVLAGIAELGLAKSKLGRKVQGIRLKSN